MASQQNSDYELLTEHFGYPPVSLLDDIINTVNVLADRALDSVERLLLSIPPQSLGFSNKHASKDGTPALPPDEAAKLEIEHGTHQLETLLNASIDKNFDLFELYTMRNILTVRPDDQPYMRLAHYEGLDFSGSEGQDRPTTESVTALRRRLHASQRLHTALESERARNDALLGKLRSVLGVVPGNVKAEEGQAQAPDGSAFGFLRDKASLQAAGADKPIATTTEFTLSQLQALRALSTSLRTLLPDLGPTDADTSMEDASSSSRTWRRERVEYVEGASRKYLESARGLELGDQGEVRDGEWQGEGRKITRSDVEGLEQVAAMLGQKSTTTDEASGDGEPMDQS
ncbi:MTW1 Determining metaphase spindle length [Fusarium tjaetaba]|uniref:MTW1 Determining metaphase spindle length n=1 Tax=Fusarium tjaetaba TaxID=1567544 RepID=A0A8H5QLE0_9HYPO|nr:MTW1 Determining metaphase spindle length [Fusarium tjaetaba]KAF5616388.1 MTW1 Determining metaphase spindle length [Fusarium tjaetaba]